MKKNCLVLISVLILSCLMIGCNNESPRVTPPPLHGVKWGMNEAETMDALRLSENEVDKPSSESIIINNGEIFV